MSSTRAKVLNLLKQFDQEFAVFSGAEESFIMDLARETLSVGSHDVFDWERLSKATYVLPACSVASRKRYITHAPEWFLKQAKARYLHQVSDNESRLEQIQLLAQLFDKAELKVLFLKGAAELVYSSEDPDYLGCRYMCDIDLLCAENDLHRVDELLRLNGHELWDHQLKHWSRENIASFSVDQYSHLIYNAFSHTYMELHGKVAVGSNRGSYPPEFEKILLEHSRQVNLRGTKVWVPKPEHLFVHSLCHAASKNNNNSLIYLDRFHLDKFAATDCVVSPPVLINQRLEMSQLKYMLQLSNLLNRFDGQFNTDELEQLLSQVAEKDLVEMYISVASYVFGQRLPIHRDVSLETIKMQHQRYISRFMIPLLAERVENIIANRLEEITDKYIEQQVEKISATIQRRVVHSVSEHLLNQLKHILQKPMRRLLSRSHHKMHTN